ncbi:MAG: epoxyqueuosine reductase QueH [Clostridia bacterium]|nr:epoxyqueuosine reductase QueH [Clostridia bacterium]
MKKLLLHSCCGPCSSGVLEDLCKEYDVTIYFYNPNIFPLEEYIKRLEAQKQLLLELNNLGYDIKLVEAEYNQEDFDNVVKGLENCKEGGDRCTKCFELRLDNTCKYAKNNNYDIFTTTMSVSPHKNFELLNSIGEELSKKYNIDYLWANFKKNNGYLKSINNSKKYNIYRQNYCGCRYSVWK